MFADYQGVVVPLPPLPEQRRIAAVLNAIRDAIAAQEDVIAAGKAFKRSLMQRLFTYGPGREPAPTKETEIGEIPAHWEVVELGTIADKITKGSSPSWQGFEYTNEGVVFVRSQNIGWGRLQLVDLARLPSSFNEKEVRSIIREGDLLVNIVGASIGRAAVADVYISGGNLNQAVAIIRLRRDQVPGFFMNYILSESGQEQLHRQKKEIARANVSLQDLKDYLVPFPLKTEQEVTTLMVDAIDAKIAAEEDRPGSPVQVYAAPTHDGADSPAGGQTWFLSETRFVGG